MHKAVFLVAFAYLVAISPYLWDEDSKEAFWKQMHRNT